MRQRTRESCSGSKLPQFSRWGEGIREYFGSGKLWSTKQNGNRSTRGASIKVGDKKMFEIQKGMGVRGRKWKQINPHVQDPLKERSGPQLKGDVTQGSGQIQGAVEGLSLGEKSVRPMGSTSHITFRAASKGRIDEKNWYGEP